MPERISETLPKPTSPDKLCLTSHTVVFLTLWQGKQILSGCSWETSLPSCRGTSSGTFEQVGLCRFLRRLCPGRANWRSKTANSFGMRNRPTAFTPGWTKALQRVHKSLGQISSLFLLSHCKSWHAPACAAIVPGCWWAGISQAAVLALVPLPHFILSSGSQQSVQRTQAQGQAVMEEVVGCNHLQRDEGLQIQRAVTEASF